MKDDCLLSSTEGSVEAEKREEESEKVKQKVKTFRQREH